MREVHLRHIDFRWVWAKVLPQVYDDSLSYYEQLCKLGQALDELATQCEEHFEEIYALIEIIQAEIERIKERLDEHDRTLADLIEETGGLREDVDDLQQIVPDISALETKTAKLSGGTTGQSLTKASDDDFDYQWSNVEGLPNYVQGDDGKILAVIDNGGTLSPVWIDPPTDIPAFYALDEGKVLKIQLVNGEPQMFWGLGVPELGASDADKILAVNSSGDGIEWKVQEGTIPVYGYEDRTKALCVNASATGVEWAARMSDLPPYSLDESKYVLSVNETGDGIFWQNNKVLGVEAFEGDGLPASNIVAKTGDIYRDKLTNKLYWCVRYIDPVNITDLSYLGVQFNATLDFSMLNFPAGAFPHTLIFDVTFDSDVEAQYHLRVDETSNGYSMWYQVTNSTGGYVVTYMSWSGSPWQNVGFKTLTNFQGNDCTNADLINFITSNGAITGAGSTWVEVSELLPIYTYTQPLNAPSFRPTGDYTYTFNVNSSGARNTLALTGASTNGTFGRIFVRRTAYNYIKKYEFFYNGTSSGYLIDNNITPAPAAEDWFVEPTPDNNGKFILNSGSTTGSFEVLVTYDYLNS